MAIVIARKPYGIGSVIALLVMIAAFVFFLIGKASVEACLVLIFFLALAVLL